MPFSQKKLFFKLFISVCFISSFGCNESGDSPATTNSTNIQADQLLGAWTGFTVDKNASSLEQQMQSGMQPSAMKVQFQQQQQITLTPGQNQPMHGNWKVISKDGQRMKIAIDLQQKDTPSLEFDIQFSSQDRFTMRRLNVGEDDPLTFTRIR